jgi:hypothetical protein
MPTKGETPSFQPTWSHQHQPLCCAGEEGCGGGVGGGGGGVACVRACGSSPSVFMLSSELQRTDVISDELKRRRCRPPRQRPCSHQCPTRPGPGRPSAGGAQGVPGSANARIARQKETRHVCGGYRSTRVVRVPDGQNAGIRAINEQMVDSKGRCAE